MRGRGGGEARKNGGRGIEEVGGEGEGEEVGGGG